MYIHFHVHFRSLHQRVSSPPIDPLRTQSTPNTRTNIKQSTKNKPKNKPMQSDPIYYAYLEKTCFDPPEASGLELPAPIVSVLTVYNLFPHFSFLLIPTRYTDHRKSARLQPQGVGLRKKGVSKSRIRTFRVTSELRRCFGLRISVLVRVTWGISHGSFSGRHF